MVVGFMMIESKVTYFSSCIIENPLHMQGTYG